VNPPSAAYLDRIATLHRELGIPAYYAAHRGLPVQPEADETVLITVAHQPDGTPVRLLPPAAADWLRLQSAAHQSGVALIALSGFRSVDRQARLIREKLRTGRTLADVLASVAAPGCSEHHTGHALDLGTPDDPAVEERFALTPAYAWLTAHAGTHGFRLSYPLGNPHGIVFEPWHWRWHG
jgi:D-alanyl-D-alanine carboxypeptidase